MSKVRLNTACKVMVKTKSRWKFRRGDLKRSHCFQIHNQQLGFEIAIKTIHNQVIAEMNLLLQSSEKEKFHINLKSALGHADRAGNKIAPVGKES